MKIYAGNFPALLITAPLKNAVSRRVTRDFRAIAHENTSQDSGCKKVTARLLFVIIRQVIFSVKKGHLLSFHERLQFSLRLKNAKLIVVKSSLFIASRHTTWDESSSYIICEILPIASSVLIGFTPFVSTARI